MSLLEFLKSLISANSLDAVSSFFTELYHQKAFWSALAVNQEGFLSKSLSIETLKGVYALKIEEKDNNFSITPYKNNSALKIATVSESSHLLKEYNSLMERILEAEIYSFQQGLIIDPQKTFTNTNVFNEDKALEWIKASFTLLEKGIVESLTNSELLFQLTGFFGVNPKSGLHEIRLIVFNLDIQYVLLKDGNLRVKIYNDKKSDFGTEKNPSLQGDFDFRKREILDELTRLLSALLPGIKIHLL